MMIAAAKNPAPMTRKEIANTFIKLSLLNCAIPKLISLGMALKT
jgi:hypothetical protein